MNKTPTQEATIWVISLSLGYGSYQCLPFFNSSIKHTLVFVFINDFWFLSYKALYATPNNSTQIKGSQNILGWSKKSLTKYSVIITYMALLYIRKMYTMKFWNISSEKPFHKIFCCFGVFFQFGQNLGSESYSQLFESSWEGSEL